jgi:uridine kinase
MITLYIEGKGEIEVQEGTTLLEISKNYQKDHQYTIIGAFVNQKEKDLHYEANSGQNHNLIDFFDLSSEAAVRMIRRGLAFVFNMAASELYPGCKFNVCHSLSKGLYCEFKYEQGFTEEMLKKIEGRMRELIDQDLPFTRKEIGLGEAREIFMQQGREDVVSLIDDCRKDYFTIYTCNGNVDCYYGNLVPSTGYLKTFELKYYEPGFVIRFPEAANPLVLPTFEKNHKLFNIFHEYKQWGSILEVENAGMINKIIKTGNIGEFIRISEGLHEKKIAQIADMIAKQPEKKVILIAGPSSSGKTTFAQRLGIQLRVDGLRPIMVSLDNYFVNRDKTPRDENGELDFESIEALDVELFNQQLVALINGEEVEVPVYNFQKGAREEVGTKLRMKEGQLLIIEGIHGLNEKLTAQISRNNKFKIYVSALTSLSIDDHNRIPTTDTRIIRRIVRDSQFRGHNATDTIKMWPSVRKGEEKYIFPFQEEADVMFNSALIYEICVLKKYAELLIEDIDRSSPLYSEARRLLNFLNDFLPVDTYEIPINSIIREFIGDGCFIR